MSGKRENKSKQKSEQGIAQEQVTAPVMLTKQQARQFMLLKHGLLGAHRFCGKQGAYEFVCQAGCIQFDPVDVCGKNAELTLQSRVKGFTKSMLYDLLYEDRLLLDYPDKNISIMPARDWPYFDRYRVAARENGRRFDGLLELEEKAKSYIKENGEVCSDTLPLPGVIRWQSAIHWSGNWNGDTNAARAVLEQLYSSGELLIHHKKGARKYYDLAERYLPEELLSAKDPFQEEREHQKWRVLRRVGAVGLLWNRASDAWLNIWGLKTPQRNDIFEQLEEEGKLLKVLVEEVSDPLYIRAEDLVLLEEVRSGIKHKPRCELIAPLDCMIWDRNLIQRLFDSEYRWEIYTPVDKRKFGYYVLPLLYGDKLVGRVEAAALAKTRTLTVKNIWFEPGFKTTKAFEKALDECIRRFAGFNDCETVKAPFCTG